MKIFGLWTFRACLHSMTHTLITMSLITTTIPYRLVRERVLYLTSSLVFISFYFILLYHSFRIHSCRIFMFSSELFYFILSFWSVLICIWSKFLVLLSFLKHTRSHTYAGLIIITGSTNVSPLRLGMWMTTYYHQPVYIS